MFKKIIIGISVLVLVCTAEQSLLQEHRLKSPRMKTASPAVTLRERRVFLCRKNGARLPTGN